jgi:hypothetical protein
MAEEHNYIKVERRCVAKEILRPPTLHNER